MQRTIATILTALTLFACDAGTDGSSIYDDQGGLGEVDESDEPIPPADEPEPGDDDTDRPHEPGQHAPPTHDFVCGTINSGTDYYTGYDPAQADQVAPRCLRWENRGQNILESLVFFDGETERAWGIVDGDCETGEAEETFWVTCEDNVGKVTLHTYKPGSPMWGPDFLGYAIVDNHYPVFEDAFAFDLVRPQDIN